MLRHYLRSGGTSAPSPCHPHFASDNRSLSISECSWEGGEGSPGCCSGEEGQHRRKAVGSTGSSSNSSRNHKCLQRFNMWVGSVSPRWEEQCRHGPFYSPAVGGAPRQTRWYRTCNSLLMNGHKNKFYNLYLHRTFILWGFWGWLWWWWWWWWSDCTEIMMMMMIILLMDEDYCKCKH